MFQATTVMKDSNIFEGRVGDHTVVMDTGSPEKAGQSPMELLLSAISGCASVDVDIILRKRRKTVTGLTVETKAERREEPYPRIFTAIHLHFILTSPDVSTQELDKALALSLDKYCSVAGMLREAADITYSGEVRQP